MLFQLIIIQVITFIAIILVLRKLLYAETIQETRRLRALREENAKREKELQEKISNAQTAYQEKIAKADEEVKKTRENAEKEIEDMRKNIQAKAREEADRIVNAAVNTKDKMRDEIANEMQNKSPMLAAEIFKTYLSSDVRQMAHKELVQAVINELKKSDKAQFNVKAKKGELLSAFPLVKQEKNQLLSTVFKRLGRKIEIEEKQDKNLVAGVKIKLDTLVIDGSLENRLRQLERK